MSRLLQFAVCTALGISCLSCTSVREQQNELPKSFDITVSNHLGKVRPAELIVVHEADILSDAADFNPRAFAVFDGDVEIASQYNAKDPYNKGIVFVADLPGDVPRTFTIRYRPEGVYATNYPKRTQAELSHKVGGQWVGREYEGGTFQNVSFLRVPPEHKDHSWYIRYEGPGWESDLVGYRFYLDQRNATDVFGKKTTDPVLHAVGLDGFDSYHNMQAWGMDVMKVGASLGVGSIGAWIDKKITRIEFTDSVTCEILENGPVYSSILTAYYGWTVGDRKYNVRSHLSIHAGTRVTVQTLELDQDAGNLCTGIVKDKNGRVISDQHENGLAYLATWGPQSLNADDLGLAVIYSTADVVPAAGEDENSHAITLRTSGQKLRYYFLAAWSGEVNGITSRESFETHLDEVIARVGMPVTVTMSGM